jgi:ABC-type transport system involved in multi-copper enzyme maturation permease subunit
MTYWLAFGVLGAILAADIAAGEIEGKTIDILLSCPVTRPGLILSRMGAVVLVLAAAAAFTTAVCLAGAAARGYPPRPELAPCIFLDGFTLSLVFASVSLLVSLGTRRRTLAVFFTLGIMGFLFMYESMLAKLYPFLSAFSFLNPFHYYRPDAVLIERSASLLNPLALLAFAAALTALSAVIFSRKDIT